MLIGMSQKVASIFVSKIPGCPIPPWKKVIAEEALVDVDALLREAGFSDGA